MSEAVSFSILANRPVPFREDDQLNVAILGRVYPYDIGIIAWYHFSCSLWPTKSMSQILVVRYTQKNLQTFRLYTDIQRQIADDWLKINGTDSPVKTPEAIEQRSKEIEFLDYAN